MESQLSMAAMPSYIYYPPAPATKVCITVPKIIERGLTQGGG